MEKRNTIFLTVISIATLLVMVVSATCSYYASLDKVSPAEPSDSNTPYKAASFIASPDDDINFRVNSYQTQENDANVTIDLTAPVDDKKIECSYDIIFVWTSEPQEEIQPQEGSQDKYYIKTSTVEKEFTIEGNPTVTINGKTQDDKTQEMVTKAFAEKNIDEYKLESKSIKDTDGLNKNIDYFVLVDDAVINSSSSKYTTSVVWNFKVRFYMENDDQNRLVNKIFSGYIMVDQDSVVCK